MPHQRQLIREAVKAKLLNATAAGTRVYETRMVPWQRLTLPAVAVYALQETATVSGSAPREFERTIQLAVEAAVSAADNVDDAADAIALDIERALHADETFNGTAAESMLTSTEIDIAEVGDRSIGLVRLTYEVVYRTYAPDAADVTLDDLKTVDVRYSLGGEQAPNDQAHDQLTDLDQE